MHSILIPAVAVLTGLFLTFVVGSRLLAGIVRIVSALLNGAHWLVCAAKWGLSYCVALLARHGKRGVAVLVMTLRIGINAAPHGITTRLAKLPSVVAVALGALLQSVRQSRSRNGKIPVIPADLTMGVSSRIRKRDGRQ